jgi:hypothetical protein
MAKGQGFLGRINAQLQWQSRIALPGAPREVLRSSCSACLFCALRGVRQDVIRVRPSSLLVSAFLLCYFFRFSKREGPRTRTSSVW